MIVEGVLVSPDVAARLARPLDELLRDARRAGVAVDPATAEVMREIVRVGIAWRARELSRTGSGTPEAERSPSCATTGADEMTTQQVAEILGTSSRNVRARARCGSLPSRMIGGRRVFDRLDIEAYDAKRRGATR